MTRRNPPTTLAVTVFLIIILISTLSLVMFSTKPHKDLSVRDRSNEFILRKFSRVTQTKSRTHTPASDTESRVNSCDLPQVLVPYMLNQTISRRFPYMEEMKNLSQMAVGMNDTRLIQLIRNYWIKNPNSRIYKFKNYQVDYSGGVSPVVDSLLEYKENGYYVDIGSSDGETNSNTLFFEKYRRWNGILIEMDPSKYRRLYVKNRQSLLVNACVSPFKFPKMITFTRERSSFRYVRMRKDFNATSKLYKKECQCLPLYSVLRAIGKNEIDFLTLKQEGDELDILNTIPFSEIYISVLSVEYNPEKNNDTEITELLKKNDFTVVMRIQTALSSYHQTIFKRKNTV